MNPLGIITGGLGLISSFFGASSQRKQQEAMIARMQRLNNDNLNRQIKFGMPFYQAGIEGLQYTRDFVNQMNRERFQGNRLYDQARATSLNEANRRLAQGQKSAAYAFGNNVGRARGEQNRIGRQYISNKNQINFDWAKQTEADRMNKTQMFLNGVSSLNRAGYTGTNIMTQAYNNYTQNAMGLIGQTPVYSPFEQLGGTLLDFGVNTLFTDTGGNNFDKMMEEYNNLGKSEGNNINSQDFMSQQGLKYDASYYTTFGPKQQFYYDDFKSPIRNRYLG